MRSVSVRADSNHKPKTVMANLEHFNNAYSRRSASFGGANPFLCHPDEVKYRQYGALVLDTLADKELVHAGTPVEVDLKAHTAKFMKLWEVVKVETADGTSTITLAAHWLAPKLTATDVVMVLPSSVNGTGKAVAAGTVTDNQDGTVSIDVTAANFDAVAAGDFLTIAAEAGTSKAVKVKANMVLTRDLYAGNGQNFVDIPRGELYCYVNTCNGIPAAVIAAAREIGLIIEPEYFAEKTV